LEGKAKWIGGIAMADQNNSPKIIKGGHQEGREDLCGEHPYGDAGQIAGFLLFLLMWVLDSFVFKLTTGFAAYVPLYARLIPAALVFALSGGMAWSGHRIVFHEVREQPHVIRKGVFSRVRHPLYLSALLIYGGLFLTTLSLISLILICGIFIFYDIIASYEERLLEGKFREEYRAYRSKTPKWVPRI
jgi:protein-S-isoprenylcysteine O-methyltransferase Ste14